MSKALLKQRLVLIPKYLQHCGIGGRDDRGYRGNGSGDHSGDGKSDNRGSDRGSNGRYDGGGPRLRVGEWHLRAVIASGHVRRCCAGRSHWRDRGRRRCRYLMHILRWVHRGWQTLRLRDIARVRHCIPRMRHHATRVRRRDPRRWMRYSNMRHRLTRAWGHLLTRTRRLHLLIRSRCGR